MSLTKIVNIRGDPARRDPDYFVLPGSFTSLIVENFGGQEPKAEGEIKSFCEGAFGITFPLTSKQVVSGGAAHPFYQWAANAAGGDGVPQWNFHKYLIGRDGRMISSFSTRLSPASQDVTNAIEKALAEPASGASGGTH